MKVSSLEKIVNKLKELDLNECYIYQNERSKNYHVSSGDIDFRIIASTCTRKEQVEITVSKTEVVK